MKVQVSLKHKQPNLVLILVYCLTTNTLPCKDKTANKNSQFHTNNCKTINTPHFCLILLILHHRIIIINKFIIKTWEIINNIQDIINNMGNIIRKDSFIQINFKIIINSKWPLIILIREIHSINQILWKILITQITTFHKLKLFR